MLLLSAPFFSLKLHPLKERYLKEMVLLHHALKAVTCWLLHRTLGGTLRSNGVSGPDGPSSGPWAPGAGGQEQVARSRPMGVRFQRGLLGGPASNAGSEPAGASQTSGTAPFHSRHGGFRKTSLVPTQEVFSPTACLPPFGILMCKMEACCFLTCTLCSSWGAEA